MPALLFSAPLRRNCKLCNALTPASHPIFVPTEVQERAFLFLHCLICNPAVNLVFNGKLRDGRSLNTVSEASQVA